MKAVFFYWSFIAADTERVLDDLARWTNIDTLLICQREGSDEAGMMLPDASAFGNIFGINPGANMKLRRGRTARSVVVVMNSLRLSNL